MENNTENLNYKLTTKDYRSNIDCYITITDNDNDDEVVFHWQFYADLDWLEDEDREEVRRDLNTLEKYCNENNKKWIQYMMNNTFRWNCIWVDYIDFSN